MKYDFDKYVNSPKIDEVYPPLFLDFYAELKDILHIDDTKALHKFINGDTCAAMTEDMIALLPSMDWASEDNISNFITDLMDRTREQFEDAYRNEFVEAKGIVRNMQLDVLLHDIQIHMAGVATCVSEVVAGWKETRIEKTHCVIENAPGEKMPAASEPRLFIPDPEREEYVAACDRIMPWLKFTSLTQVAGFLFRGDPIELSEVIADEFDYLDNGQKRDLETLIDATLEKISEEQRAEYQKLCKGVVSPRHGADSKALGVIRQNLKSEMKRACANIAEGVLAVQDQYIFPEDLKPPRL